MEQTVQVQKLFPRSRTTAAVAPMRMFDRQTIQKQSTKLNCSKPFVHQQLQEVQTIFTRVDEVFKKRKEDCVKLVWELCDMQNQLDYLQKTTKEFTDSAAAQGAALSWTKSNFSKLEQSIEDFYSKFLSPFENDYQFYHEQQELCTMFLQAYHLDLGTISTTLRESHERLTYEERNMNELMNLRNSIETTTEGMHMIANNLDITNRELNENILHLKEIQATSFEELKISFELKEMIMNEILSYAQEIELEDEIVLDKRSSKDKLIIELERLSQDLADQVTNAFELKQEKDIKINESIFEAKKLNEKLQVLKETLGHLTIEKESLLDDIHNQMKLLFEKENELMNIDRQRENFQCQLNELNNRIDIIVEFIATAKTTVSTVVADNERKYNLTCAKLKELKDLHSVDAIFRQLLYTAEQEYNKTVSFYLEQVNVVEKDINTISQQTQVETAHLTNQELQLLLAQERKKFTEEDELANQFESCGLNEEISCLDSANSKLHKQIINAEILDELYGQLKKEIEYLQEKTLAHQQSCDEMRIQRDQLVDEIKMMEMKALPPPILTEEDERKIERETAEELRIELKDLNAQHDANLEEFDAILDKLKKGFPETMHCAISAEIREMESTVEKLHQLLAQQEAEELAEKEKEEKIIEERRKLEKEIAEQELITASQESLAKTKQRKRKIGFTSPDRKFAYSSRNKNKTIKSTFEVEKHVNFSDKDDITKVSMEEWFYDEPHTLL